MKRKVLPLLLLLTISAVLSTNIHYASAQHQTITFVIDPCTHCNITIANGTGTSGSHTINSTYSNGASATFWHGAYNITAIPESGSTFKNWNYTGGITAQSNLTNPTNITFSGLVASTLTARFNAPVTAIQPIPILLLALMTAALPVLLRRTRKPSSLV